MSNIKKRVLLGMSGGIDSTMSVIKLQNADFEVVGVTFLFSELLISDDNYPKFAREAAQLAKQLKIEHHIIDARKVFNDTVIKNYYTEYLNGRTPFPCALCNKHIKWPLLHAHMKRFNCSKIATGHYAKLNKQNDFYSIERHSDSTKDQSFFLWGITQKILQTIIFPLENLSKAEVKKLAAKNNLKDVSEKGESFGACFVPDGDYTGYIKKQLPDVTKKIRPGNFIDTQGKILGRHQGIIHYTIGQKVVSPLLVDEELYVKEIRIENNTIVIAKSKYIYTVKMRLSDYVLHDHTLLQNTELEIRFVYRGEANRGTIHLHDDELYVHLIKPEPSVSKGQTAVFYNENCVVGGGFIAAIWEK